MKTITLTQTVEIKKVQNVASCRQGTLQGIRSSAMITSVLGFGPTRYSKDDGDGKVTMEWSFEIAGKLFSIWDYKGSASFGQFSTYGNSTILKQLFGDSFKAENF